MNIEEIKNKVTQFFSSNGLEDKLEVKEVIEAAPAVEKFETVLLADGTTEVTIEPAVEAGAAIVITSEDGTPVAAPVGELELSDGRVVVIAEEGVVAEVRDSEEVEEPLATDEPDSADKVKRVIESIVKEKVFATLEDIKEIADTSKFNKIEGETLLTRISELEAFVKETMTEILTVVSAEPSKEPAEEKVDPLKAFSSEESQFDAWVKKQNEK